MQLRHAAILFLVTCATAQSASAAGPGPEDQCRFIGIRDFSAFEAGTSTNATVLLSPLLTAPLAWNELIVSWNAVLPSNAWLKVEVMGRYPDHATAYYTLGVWPPDPIRNGPGGGGQADADGRVNTDTLVLNRPGADARLRLTLAGAGGAMRPRLKFLGLSFLDNRVQPAALPPNRAAWGKIIPTPERSQHAASSRPGLCSPASLAMVLARWGGALRRPELDLEVTTVADAVNDPALPGTGNWSFNTAYAGSLPGLRAYVARLSDLCEIEDWIAAGIPVVLSAPWHLLSPGRKDTGSGHLAVCIGFTGEGDVVMNDPAADPRQGGKVRCVYARRLVMDAWKASHNTVYLIYPETAQIPPNRFGQWEDR